MKYCDIQILAAVSTGKHTADWHILLCEQWNYLSYLMQHNPQLNVSWKSGGKWPLGRHRGMCEDCIKMDIK
jgi:hypothetical protein